MYKIDKKNKSLSQLESPSFKEMELEEVNDLQEWVANHPEEIISEPLLIVGKEYQDFVGTRDRLDLLAVDKDGNLVVIENKRDNSGRNVVGQATKYASYCSKMTKDVFLKIYQKYLGQDADAGKRLCAFLNAKKIEDVEINADNNIRIILVAGVFANEAITHARHEVEQHGKNIKLVEVALFKFEDNLFFDADVIYPNKDLEERVISGTKIGSKQKRKKVGVPEKFWKQLNVKIALSNLSGQMDQKETNAWRSYLRFFPDSNYFNVDGVEFWGLFQPRVKKMAIGFEVAKAKNPKFYEILSENDSEIKTRLGGDFNWFDDDPKKLYVKFIQDNVTDIRNEKNWDSYCDMIINKLCLCIDTVSKYKDK